MQIFYQYVFESNKTFMERFFLCIKLSKQKCDDFVGCRVHVAVLRARLWFTIELQALRRNHIKFCLTLFFLHFSTFITIFVRATERNSMRWSDYRLLNEATCTSLRQCGDDSHPQFNDFSLGSGES